MNNKNRKYLSKCMSKILRHKAPSYGIEIDSEGFIKLDELLEWIKGNQFVKNPELKPHVNLETVQIIVGEDNKQRFKLIQDKSKIWKIRANQGHSFRVKDLELVPISLEDVVEKKSYGCVGHGTQLENLNAIRKTGLKKMSRTHIHMTDLSTEKGASLMRHDVNVFVWVNIEKAIKDGINFFRSDNNVILCEMDIPPKYLTFLLKADKRIPCLGVIVYGEDESGQKYLPLVKSPNGNLSFPKGKRNKGEFSVNTALRELHEETGIRACDIEFIDHKPLIELGRKKPNSKREPQPAIYYYVAKYKYKIDPKNLNLTFDDPNELDSSKWYPYEQVLNWKDEDGNGYLMEKRVDICKQLTLLL